MLTVMGATGNTGTAVTRLLLDAGEEVRAVGRSEAKLADLARAGAEPMVGDATDPDVLTKAFAGADAVYTLVAADPSLPGYAARQDEMGESVVTALQESGVRYAVALSSLGADVPSGTGLIGTLRAQEQRLQHLQGVNVLALRPGLFFETFRESLDAIRQEGVHADAVAPDVPIPMIAARDIAAVAAGALRARDWSGLVVRELLGQRDLTFAEVTTMIGERIGTPDLAYVQVPPADMVGALVAAGLSESFAGLHVEMAQALNEGRIASREGRRPENTTPTRFEDFAGELAQAYLAP